MSLFTVDDMLMRAVRQWPDRPFLISGDQSVTFRQLGEMVDRFAGWLYREGVRAGDRVGVHVQKSPEEIAVMLAAARIGAAWVNLSVHWNTRQVRDQAEDCGMKILVVNPRRASELLKDGLPEALEKLVVLGEGDVEGDPARWVPWAE